MKLVFATHNKNKIKEIVPLLPPFFELVSLDDLGCHEEIPETGKTLEENALIKASYVKTHFGLNCFADDSGLEVLALGGAPGVYSARYAGASKSDRQNIDKLLSEMQNITQREAQFRTVIALLLNNNNYFFEGIVKGSILDQPRGQGGFGYDPVFRPEGYTDSFGILPSAVKNQISHRARAVTKMLDFLKRNSQ
ncbi:MAG: non-canonical purine NTP diphosphatase [Flavobacteriaceae bacterium]